MRWLLVPLLFIAVAYPAKADDSVQNAFLLCALADNTGLFSAPCDVSGWNSTVTMTVALDAAEARVLCAKFVDLMASKNLNFTSGWRLQINAPQGPMAFCALR